MNFEEIQKALDAIKTAYDEAEYNYEEAIVDFIKAFLKEYGGEYKFKFDTSCVIAVTDYHCEEIEITEVTSIYIDDVDGDTIMVDTYKNCVDLRSLDIRDMESIVNELMLEIDDEEE